MRRPRRRARRTGRTGRPGGRRRRIDRGAPAGAGPPKQHRGPDGRHAVFLVPAGGRLRTIRGAGEGLQGAEGRRGSLVTGHRHTDDPRRRTRGRREPDHLALHHPRQGRQGRGPGIRGREAPTTSAPGAGAPSTDASASAARVAPPVGGTREPGAGSSRGGGHRRHHGLQATRGACRTRPAGGGGERQRQPEARHPAAGSSVSGPRGPWRFAARGRGERGGRARALRVAGEEDALAVGRREARSIVGTPGTSSPRGRRTTRARRPVECRIPFRIRLSSARSRDGACPSTSTAAPGTLSVRRTPRSAARARRRSIAPAATTDRSTRRECGGARAATRSSRPAASRSASPSIAPGRGAGRRGARRARGRRTARG